MRAVVPVLSALLLVVAACPAEPPPDGADAGPSPTGRPPFEVVDGGSDPSTDAGSDPVCVDDDREDNDTQATATVLADGDTVEARFCGGDDDWYAVNVGAADCSVAVTVVTHADAAAGEGEGEGEGDPGSDAALDDLDLVLVDIDGNVVGGAAGLGPREALNVRVAQSGRYAARVRGGSSDDVAYALTIAVTCGGDQVCPSDDAYEQNDAAASAAAVDRGVAVDAAVCGADVDFWSLPVQPGCLADVTATFSHSRGDIDLSIVDRATGAPRATSAGTRDSEHVAPLLDDPSAYAARVILFRGSDENVGNAYRFVVEEVCPGDLGCPGDDPNEDNDTRQTAKTFGKDDATLGTTCGVDEDFFRVSPQSGCTTTFDVAFRHADGDIDIELLDGNGARITNAASSDDDEQIRYAATSNSAVVLRIFGFRDAQNRYRLTTTTTCP